MKKRLLASIILCFILGISRSWSTNYEVVPKPQKIIINQGKDFILNSQTRIFYPKDNKEMQSNAEFLSSYIEAITGFKPSIQIQPNKIDKKEKNYILLSLTNTNKVSKDKNSTFLRNKEGYVLTINDTKISITSTTSAGIFYGIQTLRKALPVTLNNKQERVNTSEVPLSAVEIADAPTFGFRGMMLDCGRHFFTTHFIKRFIDLLAMHNMNVFHWHLTEDQGWRIEIKKYPKLTEVGSMRSGTVLGNNSEADDSIAHGGYYTQEQAKEIVSYAAKRHIMVIPELDVPGHSVALLASYPEMGCTQGPYEVEHRWGVFPDVVCLGNEKVYPFLHNIIDELCEIFPAPYFHIGGDESPTTRWEHCEKCKTLAQKEGVDVKKLQSVFTHRLEEYVKSKGKKPLAWDEVLQEGIDTAVTIMSWRGAQPGFKAAEAGHDVIMSPIQTNYFSRYQFKDRTFEPAAANAYLPIKDVYNFNPTPNSLSTKAKNHIKGVHGALWTEHIGATSHAEYMVLPRLAALCEVQWSSPETKNFDTFLPRAKRLSSLYKLYNYNFARKTFKEVK